MCRKLFFLTVLALVLGMVSTNVVHAAGKANLIGWWKFDGDMKDSSGLGNDGVRGGNPTFIAGRVGTNALNLDGDDYVAIDGVVDDITSTNITINVWIKTTSGSEGNVFAANNSGSDYALMFGIQGGNPYRWDAGDQQYPPAINDDQWHMLTYVRNGSTGYIYVDGVQRATYSSSFTWAIVTRWSIGQEWDDSTPSDFYTGALDDARIYDGSLSAEHVLGLFNGIEPMYVKATDPDPVDGAIYPDTWVSLAWSPGDTAASHDVYLGESFDEVNEGTGDTFQGNRATDFYVIGFPGFPYPDGLVPGTTYYWRVDEVEANGTTKHKGDVWSFSVPPMTAYNPSPSDNVKFVAPDATLSWIAGFGAKVHYVYFGTSFDQVNNAAGALPQAAATYKPGSLAVKTTYYWRVDEFNGRETFKGDVWSFKTRPAITITDPDLIGWWKFDEGYGNTALDWSGHENHGTLGGDPQWVEGIMNGALDLSGNDYVAINGVVDDITSTNITLSVWIKTTQGSEGNVFAANDSGSDYALMFGIQGGNPYRWDVADEQYPPAINDGQWHMLTYVRDGSRASIYVDAVQRATYSSSFTWDIVTRWSIGQEWDDSTRAIFISVWWTMSASTIRR